MAKQTDVVQQAASSAAPEDSLHVVLELGETAPQHAAAPQSRAEMIRSAKESFARHVQPLREKIEHLGGEVLDEAWLNSTISARIPKQVLAELEHDERVHSIDLPRMLERE